MQEDSALLGAKRTKPPEASSFWKRHYNLYLCNTLSSWGDRMWEYASYYALSVAFPNSLVVPSLYALITTAVTFFLGSLVGRQIDKNPRFYLMSTATFIQNLSVAASTCLVMFIYLHYRSRKAVPWHDIGFDFSLIGLIFFGCISALAGMATRISLNKDWVVVVSENTKDATITDLNAMSTRISLTCKVLAPVFFSVLLTYFSLWTSLVVAAAWNLVSAVVEIFLLKNLTDTFPELDNKEFKYVPTMEGHENLVIEEGTRLGKSSSSEADNDSCFGPYKLYFSQSVLFASAAYVLLYMTVISPGALITNYLVYKEMGAMEIAGFQAAASVVGFAATLVATPLINSPLGVGWVGLGAVWFQLAVISLTILQLFFYPDLNLWLLLAPVIVSRAPLWIFDIVEVQITQEEVSPTDRGKVNSVEFSFTSFMTLISFALGLIAGEPENFKYLCLVSIGFVGAAAICFTVWFIKSRFRASQRYEVLEELERREDNSE